MKTKEAKKLENVILSNLYKIYLKSKVEDWTQYDNGSSQYKYIKENIGIFVHSYKPEKKKQKKKISFFIFPNLETAKISSVSGHYGYKYSKEFLFNGVIFSLRKMKFLRKYNSIVNFFQNKAEYDSIKAAYDALPLTIRRKAKLDKLDEVQNEDKKD